MKDDDDTFDWSSDATLSEQRAIAVYTNNSGDIVIREHRILTDEEDSIIVITKNNIAAFIRALKREVAKK